MTWPPTPAAVAAFGQVDSVTQPLTDATNAAVAFVEEKRADLATGQEDPPFDADAKIVLGTMMLALRWYERRGSILGVAGYAQFDGGSSPLLRVDPDIEQLLGIGRQTKFGFGSAPLDDEQAS